TVSSSPYADHDPCTSGWRSLPISTVSSVAFPSGSSQRVVMRALPSGAAVRAVHTPPTSPDGRGCGGNGQPLRMTRARSRRTNDRISAPPLEVAEIGQPAPEDRAQGAILPPACQGAVRRRQQLGIVGTECPRDVLVCQSDPHELQIPLVLRHHPRGDRNVG